ncbi:MAG TPA: DUF4147 domain-containing protein [Chthonomonadales bacterium]|nr:DUF4147 domain-containing protein [Chthonomonadales bacterium]
MAVYGTALGAVRADGLVRAALRTEDDALVAGSAHVPLRGIDAVHLLAVGKAAAPMAAAAMEAVGPLVAGGLVITKDGHGNAVGALPVLEAGHPTPDRRSAEAGAAAHGLVRGLCERDLLLCLLSGGASSLMELPVDGVSLEDLACVTQMMLEAGAPIQELNAVRACLSRLKAGGLARAASPARVACLAVSDVIGSPLAVIGSGPCHLEVPPDGARAREVLGRRGLLGRTPPAVLEALHRATPTAGPPTDDAGRVTETVIGDLWTALDAAREEARRLGLRPAVLTGSLSGEARDVGALLGAMARDLPRTSRHGGPDCLIAGGETTVTVRGAGRGGRSQEIAVAAAIVLDGAEGVALLAAGTDGTDGPTDAAGGLVDGRTAEAGRAAGANAAAALESNDACTYLTAASALVTTGPTGANVGDLAIVVRRPA